MKELFKNPEIEIYKLTCEDVVCTSSVVDYDDGGDMGIIDDGAPEYDF